jgi:surfeit locus 1 family protein
MGTQPYNPAQAKATSVRRDYYRRMGIGTAIFLILFGLFIRAGFWQLDRAGQKLALQTSFAVGAEAERLRVLAGSEEAGKLRYRRFELAGSFDPEHQILLDNMVSGGLNGYQVLTPFRIGNKVVLVNRGWVPAAPDRSLLPDISVDATPRTIVARLNRLPAPGIRLDAPMTTANVWPKRMLYPDQQALAAILGLDVPDYQLLLEPDQADGYQRDWQAVGTGPERNYGYAFQWFAFALLALVLFSIICVRWNRQYRKITLHTQHEQKPS